MTKSSGTAAVKGVDWEFIKGISVHAGDEKTLQGNTQAMDGKKTLVLLLLSPITGFIYVLAFPVLCIATAIRVAWTKRKEKQTRLEREHSRVAAFLLSFASGLLYVVFFPLIVFGALIRKFALKRMERQKA